MRLFLISKSHSGFLHEMIICKYAHVPPPLITYFLEILKPSKMTFLQLVFKKTIYYCYDTTSKIKATLPHKNEPSLHNFYNYLKVKYEKKIYNGLKDEGK